MKHPQLSGRTRTLGDKTMQGKIRAVPTLAYGEPMAETDAHRARCLYSQNPQMPDAHPPNALGLSRVLALSRPDTFAFSGIETGRSLLQGGTSRPDMFTFLGLKTPSPFTNCKFHFRILNRTATPSFAPRGVGKRYRIPLDFLPRGYLCSSRATEGALHTVLHRDQEVSPTVLPTRRDRGGQAPALRKNQDQEVSPTVLPARQEARSPFKP